MSVTADTVFVFEYSSSGSHHTRADAVGDAGVESAHRTIGSCQTGWQCDRLTGRLEMAMSTSSQDVESVTGQESQGMLHLLPPPSC
jgi:hypothetical protein